MQRHDVTAMDDDRRLEWCELGIWTTKDGDMVPVAEMSDRHLLNVVRMIKRSAQGELTAAIDAGYGMLMTLSGDGAITNVENELSRLIDVDAKEWVDGHPFMPHARAELARRGLVEPAPDE